MSSPPYDSSFLNVQWLIPFNKPYVFPEGLKAIARACEAGKLSGDGENTKRCAEWFGERFGYERCLLTPSCTAALEMAALLLELKDGDEVICPSFTFVSSANAFALRGATVVFADSEPDSPNMSVDDALSKVTDRTRAIVVVHYAGVPVDLSRLVATGIPVVEDCAHAIGSVDPRTGENVGTRGCMATFSFHETKNISVGEGGLLVVNDNDSDLWEKAQIIREKGTNRTQFREGRSEFYTWLSLGSSYLMSEVDAGLLLGALQNYDKIQDSRRAVWDTYHESILPSNLYRKNKTSSRANAHMYYLTFATKEQRTDFTAWMKDAGILVATHYMPLDTSPYAQEQRQWQQQGANEHNEHKLCAEAKKWSDTLVRLPLYYALSKEEMHKVISTVNGYASARGLVYCRVSKGHYEEIRHIRNSSRNCFGNPEEIDAVTHKNFMEKHDANYRVVLNRWRVIAFIGQVKNDLRVAVDPSMQGLGVAQFMYSLFLDEYPDVTVQVLRDNEKSLRFFKKLGWRPNSSMDERNPVPLQRVSE